MRIMWNVAGLTIAVCVALPASARAQWAVLDSAQPPNEVGLLSQPGERSFVLRQPLNETQLWLFRIDSNGFKEGFVTAYYQDAACSSTPYIFTEAEPHLVIIGIPLTGDQVVYAADVGQVLTFNSSKALPGGTCQTYSSTLSAAPMLSRPLTDFTRLQDGTALVPPFVLRRY